MNKRILAYAVIILLAGYFYSDYAKAEQTAHYCGSLTDTEVVIEEKCVKGDVVLASHADAVRKICDFSYQVIEFGIGERLWMCIYRGAIRTHRKRNRS